MAPDWRRKIFKTHSQQDGDGPDDLYQPAAAQLGEDAVLDYSTVDLFGDDPEPAPRGENPLLQSRLSSMFGQGAAVPPAVAEAALERNGFGDGARPLTPAEGRSWEFDPLTSQARGEAGVHSNFDDGADFPPFDEPAVPEHSAPAASTPLPEYPPWNEPQPAPEYVAHAPTASRTEWTAEPAATWTERPAEAQESRYEWPGEHTVRPTEWRTETATSLPAWPEYASDDRAGLPAAPQPNARQEAMPPPEPKVTEPRTPVATPQHQGGDAQMNDDTRLAEEISRRLNAVAGQLGELAAAVMELERRQREREQSVQSVVAQISALSTQLHSAMPSLQEAPLTGGNGWSGHAAA